MHNHSTQPVQALTAWTPVLEGADAEQAMAALEAIAKALSTRYPQPTLAGGEAGAALFFGYLAQAQPDRDWDTRAMAHLEQAVTALGESVLRPTLYSGFSGIAWAMDHLEGRLFEVSEEDSNEEIDAALETHLGQDKWEGDYDLISGLVGYGLYALDRLERPSGRRLLLRVLDLLDVTKVEREGGFTWHTAPDLIPSWQKKLHPEGYFNLGLAHGVPAVIALLAQAHAAGIDTPRTMALLEGAMHWFLAQKHPEGSGSCFGSLRSAVEDRDPDIETSRLAWCYGDLGACAALFWAAQSVGRSDWEAEALVIARAAARRSLAESGVKDAGLCHGSAGNAHLFNRLWQGTGEELFRQAARSWFQETLRLRVPEQGIGGFRAWMPRPEAEGNPDPWGDAEGLLEGAAGVGLSLMAGLYPVIPDWDRMLLVAVRPGPSVQR